MEGDKTSESPIEIVVEPPAQSEGICRPGWLNSFENGISKSIRLRALPKSTTHQIARIRNIRPILRRTVTTTDLEDLAKMVRVLGSSIRKVANVPCFFEADIEVSLIRRSLAEGIGTMMLTLVVSGSGSSGNSLSAGLAIGTSLIGLILAIGSVSGGHFNPTITLLQWIQKERRLGCAVCYVSAQIAGGISGCLVSAAIYAAPLSLPTTTAPPVGFVASEAVASFGLMTIVFCCSRSADKLAGPFAVGLWLTAAILSTPTGSIANPAVAIGLLAAPAHTSIIAVPSFVVAQLAGGVLAMWFVSIIYPHRNSRS